MHTVSLEPFAKFRQEIIGEFPKFGEKILRRVELNKMVHHDNISPQLAELIGRVHAIK